MSTLLQTRNAFVSRERRTLRGARAGRFSAPLEERWATRVRVRCRGLAPSLQLEPAVVVEGRRVGLWATRYQVAVVQVDPLSQTLVQSWRAWAERNEVHLVLVGEGENAEDISRRIFAQVEALLAAR